MASKSPKHKGMSMVLLEVRNGIVLMSSYRLLMIEAPYSHR